MGNKMDTTNCAVVRAPAKSCVNGICMTDKGKVDPDNAFMEHQFTIDVCKKIGLKVFEIEAEEEYPDCVFIEDPVFFMDNKAFFPILVHPSRRGEGIKVKEFVQKNFSKLQCIDMTGEGHMDGGDILFLGGPEKEILCGVSSRTNEEGVKQLQAAFPEYVITPIPVPPESEGGLLHLITHTSRFGPGPQLVIGKSAASQKIKKTIEEKAKSKVEFFEVEDDWAANCIYVNGYVLHCSEEEYPKSFKQFQEKFGEKGIPMKNKEFDKVDGSLTCRVRQLNYN